MFNPIFKKNDQGQKHPGSCVFAEPELLRIDRKVINSHKNPSDSHNYHYEKHDEIKLYLVTGVSNDIQH